MRGVNFGFINYSSNILYTYEVKEFEDVNLITGEDDIVVTMKDTIIEDIHEDREVEDSLLNIGIINKGERSVKFNLGIINYTEGETLVDLGIINYADGTIFQLGAFNATDNLEGIQIGLINYAKNGIYPVLPIVNFRVSIQ